MIIFTVIESEGQLLGVRGAGSLTSFPLSSFYNYHFIAGELLTTRNREPVYGFDTSVPSGSVPPLDGMQFMIINANYANDFFPTFF